MPLDHSSHLHTSSLVFDDDGDALTAADAGS
jgi:hypothetical protein